MRSSDNSANLIKHAEGSRVVWSVLNLPSPAARQAFSMISSRLSGLMEKVTSPGGAALLPVSNRCSTPPLKDLGRPALPAFVWLWLLEAGGQSQSSCSGAEGLLKKILTRGNPAGPPGDAELHLDHFRNRSQLLDSAQHFMTSS